MAIAYKNRQSYGMPLNKYEQGGGSNADGSKSTMYCSHCYRAFTRPDLTVDGMKLRVKDKIKEFGFPGFLAGFFTMGIPKLER